MKANETKRIRNLIIYWILSSILFLIDALLRAFPGYNNTLNKQTVLYILQGIKTPLLINPNYLTWGITSLVGVGSIICLVILLLMPQKSKDMYFIGVIPSIISIITLVYGVGTFWSILNFIFTLMILWNSLSLTGRIKQLTSYINKKIFQNVKIVTGMIWIVTTTALILDVVLRAIPEYQTDGTQHLVRAIIELLGAGGIVLSFLLFSSKISNRKKFWVGAIPAISAFLGFFIGFPISMTSIWLWISLVFSILTLVQFAKMFGEIKEIKTFNRKMSSILWLFTSAAALVNLVTEIFPLYNIQNKDIQLNWWIWTSILAVSILIPLPMYIHDSMKNGKEFKNKLFRYLIKAKPSLKELRTKKPETKRTNIFYSGVLAVISGLAIGWDIGRDYLYFIWIQFSDWTIYQRYLIPLIINAVIGATLLILIIRFLIQGKDTKLDKILTPIPLALSFLNLILYTNLNPLSFYISWIPVFLVSCVIFILGLRGQVSVPSKWMVIGTGLLPSVFSIISFILAIYAEKLNIWSWMSLIAGLLATFFAILITGNPNNQKRRVIKFGKTWEVFKQNWMGMTGLILLSVIVILAIGGSNLTKWDPDGYFIEDRLQAPTLTHILGTNRYGQDVFTVLLDSLSISLLIGVIAGSLTVILGTTIGVASAYLGGWVDTIIMRITDVVLVLPALPLMLVLASLPFLFGKVHWSIIAVVYILVFWPVSARLIRGQALSIKERAFVTSAKSSGAGSAYIIFKHILPNVFPLMLTMIITSMRQAILYESFLSYLGLGDPLNWTLGQMLYIAEKQAAFASGAWWMFFPPGIAIGLITLSFAFIGMALDEIVNPRLRKR